MKKLLNYFLAFVLFSSAVLFLGTDSSSDYTVTSETTQLQQSVFNTIYITSLDSLETRTPSFSNNEFFDAALFNNPDDSVLITAVQGAANTTDSGLYTLVGTFDGVTLNAIDTITTAGTTLCQRRLVVTEAGKLTYPFWGVKAVMSDGSAGTLKVWLQNYPKQQRVVVDTTL